MKNELGRFVAGYLLIGNVFATALCVLGNVWHGWPAYFSMVILWPVAVLGIVLYKTY